MRVSKQNREKVVYLGQTLRHAASELDTLRTNMMLVYDTLQRANDPEKSTSDACLQCVTMCRQLAVMMRREASEVTPAEASRLARIGLGAALLGTHVLAGISDGASSVITTTLLEESQTSATVAERACEDLDVTVQLLVDVATSEPLRLRLPETAQEPRTLDSMKALLREHPGDSRVFLHLAGGEMVRLPDDLLVSLDGGLVAELRVLLGPDVVIE